jgi:PAS domain S-box-containing protein
MARWRRPSHDDPLSSEARYRALLERLPVVIYHYSDAGTSDYTSPNIEEILGYPASAYLADPTLWHRTIHPADDPRMREAWHHAERTRTSYEVECRYLRPDGSVVWVRDTARVVRLPDGDLEWQGVLVEITSEKLAELERQRSERRYRALVEQVPAIVYEMGPDDERRTLFVSPHAEELLGYDRQEWLDQSDIWIELLHPEDRETELAAMDVHNQTGEPWGREYRLIASDGSVVWVRDQAKLVRDPHSGLATWHGVMLDISERRELEDRLRLMNDDLEIRVERRTAELADSVELMGLEIGERLRVERELVQERERYQRLIEDLPAVVYTWEILWDGEEHRAGGDPYTSPQIEAILGFTPNEWGIDVWKERLHPHDRDRVLALSEASVEAGVGFDAEYRYLAKDGRVVWVLDRASLLSRDQRGRPRLFQGAIFDITARKEAEQKAAEAEARYRTLSEAGPAVFYIYELDHRTEPTSIRIEYLSPQIADMLGFAGAWWQDDPKRWFELVHPDDRDALVIRAEQVWRTGAPWSNDYRLITNDGVIIWVRDQGRLVSRDGYGRPHRFQGMLLDITARKEEELALQAVSSRHRDLLEGMPAMPWSATVDPETGRERYSYVGPQSVELLGYAPDELSSEAGLLERMVHPDDRDRLLRANREALRSGDRDERFRVIRRDGVAIWLHSLGRRVSEPGEAPQRWQGLSMAIPTSGGEASAGEVDATTAGAKVNPSA